MINSTQFSYFTLGAYFDIGLLKYLCFMIFMSLYILIMSCNLLLIVVICLNRSLHEPMYIFLCSLFVNELYGSTELFPFLLLQILSDIHTVPFLFCYLQIFCLYSYGSVEYLNLAVMSYDRYLAICHPLQYNTRMTSKKIAMLIVLTWLISFLCVGFAASFRSSFPLCGNIIDKVYCDNYSIIKLACYGSTVYNIYGFISIGICVFCPVVLILYTYIKILKICFSGSKQTRQKAVSTCTPHLASLLNFSFGACFEMIQNRFDMKSVPNILSIILSLYWLTCQPIFNPVLYGLKLSKIRTACKSLFGWKVEHPKDLFTLTYKKTY